MSPYTNISIDTQPEQLAAMKTKTTECETCWGTGYYHGYGAPCAEGCKSPTERVGLAAEDAPIELISSGSGYKMDETQQAVDRITRLFQNPDASALKGEEVRVVMKHASSFERTKTGKIEGGQELNGELVSIRLRTPLGVALIAAHRITKIVRLSDSKTIWRS